MARNHEAALAGLEIDDELLEPVSPRELLPGMRREPLRVANVVGHHDYDREAGADD